MTLPADEDIVERIKEGATVETQEKIIQLRATTLGLQEENSAHRERIRTLEDELKSKQQLKYEIPVHLLLD